MFFRKKPVIVEARQLTRQSLFPIIIWVNEQGGKTGEWIWDIERFLTIETLEGNHKAQEGDWLIKGVAGEFYPCKPDIFQATYEEVK